MTVVAAVMVTAGTLTAAALLAAGFEARHTWKSRRRPRRRMGLGARLWAWPARIGARR